MALEIIDVSYELDRESPTGTVIYGCGWNEAPELATVLVGGLISVEGYMLWQPPALIPDFRYQSLLQ